MLPVAYRCDLCGYASVHLGAGGHSGVALISNVGLERVTDGFTGELAGCQPIKIV